MLFRECLYWLGFGHANAATWIANATAGGAMQAPRRNGSLKTVVDTAKEYAPDDHGG